MKRTLANTILKSDYDHVVHMLNQPDVNVNDIDEYGLTPLIEAVIVEKLDVIKLLLERGALIDEPDISGRTALYWAVDANNFEIAKFLLENKANANAYTRGAQPIFSMPLLRGKENIKQLLYHYSADLAFAQDFINTKLIGHRYEIEGKIHIVDPDKRFIVLDFEGFYLEATLGIILDSITRFKNNFAAKHLQIYAKQTQKIISALNVAHELILLQNYYNHLDQYRVNINGLLTYPLLLIPVAYQGHAITCIRYKDYWIKCDRGYNSKLEGSVVIYRMQRPDLITKDFLFDLIYKSHPNDYINQGINEYLGLTPIGEIPLPAQVIGNCSWANVEASVPAMLFLLLLSETIPNSKNIKEIINIATDYFFEWREWDKDRALEECIQSFNNANQARQASKVALLANVLVEKCHYNKPRELKRAEKIFPYLFIQDYRYILDIYIKAYIENGKTELGENLIHLFDLAAPTGVKDLLQYKPMNEEG